MIFARTINSYKFQFFEKFNLNFCLMFVIVIKSVNVM